MHQKRIKHLGINLPKGTKDVYFKIFKMLIKEIEDEQIDGKINCVPKLQESMLSK